MTSLIIIVCGLLGGLLLFWRLPRLNIPADTPDELPDFSVIIPMRDEAANIGPLLASIRAQDLPPREIICVDDGSRDSSAAIARAAGAQVMTVINKPAAWTGKSFACHFGASHARGRILVFLDADVRLEPAALRAIIAWQTRVKGVISVQPYHRVRTPMEHCSLFFNLVVLAGSGIGLPFMTKKTILFGPVLAIDRRTYTRFGGHAPAKGSVLEDLQLGRHYQQNRLPCQLLIGRPLISFSMYRHFRELWQGWSKNFFSGSVSIPFWLALLIGLQLTGYASAAVRVLENLVRKDPTALAIAGAAYLLSVLQIGWAARQAGSFHLVLILFYPVFFLIFFLIFLVSAVKKLILHQVRWKGRDIRI
jgi:4,4'-diaponeurosporenoate glycosyltransferase